jgi:CBS domain containing-hemolysin-like protein
VEFIVGDIQDEYDHEDDEIVEVMKTPLQLMLLLMLFRLRDNLAILFPRVIMILGRTYPYDFG